MSTSETVSLFVGSALDDLGFNDSMVEYRREIHRQIQNAIYDRKYVNDFGNDFEIIINEHLSEIIMVKEKIICLSEEDKDFECGEKQIAFVADKSMSPPGYTRLKLTTYSSEIDSVFSSSFEQPGYLRGSDFSDKMNRKFGRNMKKGFTELLLHADPKVIFPLILLDTNTVSRVKRKLKSPQNTQEVCPAEGFVIPDSFSSSDEPDFDWRISYTRTEQKLLLTLNTTHLKLLTLLNMIGKSTLFDISNEINSNVMRNIVFWMDYLCDPEVFKEKYLMNLLVTALWILYNCVKCGFIPCFMTEKRNLLTKPMEVPRKHALLEMLFMLQKEQACLLLRCEKLKCVMLMKFRSPHLVDMYQKQRNYLEMLLLSRKFIIADYKKRESNSTKGVHQADVEFDIIVLLVVTVAMFKLIYPGWVKAFHEGENVREIVIGRIREILDCNEIDL